MNIFRKLAVGLCAGLLSTALLALAWTNIGLATIHNRQVVKSWFENSDFYNQVGNIAVDSIKLNDSHTSMGSPAGSGIPISDPAVQTIVKDTLNASLVRTNVNTVLDSIYTWLGGTDKNLSFSLDLTSAKEQLATGLSSYAKTHAAGLPRCGAVNRNDPVDPYGATCLPLGVTPDQVAVLAKQQFLAQDFFKNPVIKGEDFKIKDKDGNSIPVTSDNRAQLTRKAYQLSGDLPVIFTVISVVLIVGIVFLSRDRLRGIRRVGTVFLTSGLSLILLYFLTKLLFQWAIKRISVQNTTVTTQTKLGIDFIGVALKNFERVLLTHAVAFTVLGLAAIILGSVLLRRNRQEDETPTDDSPSAKPLAAPEVPVFDRPAISPRPITPGAPPRPKQPRKLQF